MKRKGISILSEIILAVGIIAAASIFFIIGYRFLGYETTQSYSFTQIRFLEDLGNRIDSAYAFSGITTIQYEVPVKIYTLRGQNNTLILKTPGKETESYKLFSGKLNDFNISDEEFICLHFFNKTITVSPGKCHDLGVGSDFCANLRCVDGICTPDYGENCESPDCNCSSGICEPNYKEECLDEKGCVNESCIGILNRNESCEYDWECGIYNGENMKCKPSKINPNNKGCCPPDEVWNGTQCTIGCLGDPCDTNNECGTADQCGTSKDLKCNPTTQNFTDYEKGCCPSGKSWNGSDCVEIVCPESITSCYNHWHWENYGLPNGFDMNVKGYSCDYYEVCQKPVVKPIAKEIINCCNNKCAGDCHSLCNKALQDSGLSNTDTPETRKKCYGLYAIYGLGPAARWLQGYQIHTEQPASIMLSSGTWMCTGYSIEVTTLLRSVGYSKEEAMSACGPGHAYNLVKFPGENKYRFVDTVGNGLYISGISGSDWYRTQYGSCRTDWTKPCQNDEYSGTCPAISNIMVGASC